MRTRGPSNPWVSMAIFLPLLLACLPFTLAQTTRTRTTTRPLRASTSRSAARAPTIAARPISTLPLGRLEPPAGKLLLGAWVDSMVTPEPDLGNDLPVKLNQRLGYNLSSFQLVQNIPHQRAYANFTRVEETGTDAIVFLTINNDDGFEPITDDEITFLVDQLYDVSEVRGRNVMVRFMPEMNGNWYVYGQQPTLYTQTWIRFARAVRARAPKVALVWSPNPGSGYPYGGPPRNAPYSPEDLALLDTNRDGRVTWDDDPYTPFYPGDEWVDWVGMSIYYKGLAREWPWKTNGLTPPTFVREQIEGGREGGNARYNFYTMFCSDEGGRGKPFAISETGGAFHIATDKTGPIEPGPGHLAISRSFWQTYLTNTDFFRRFPKIKFVSLFEFKKPLYQAGENILRDYRITWDPEILKALKNDMASVGLIDKIEFAKPRAFVAPVVDDQANGQTGRRRRNAAKRDASGGFRWGCVAVVGVALFWLV
ncbi:hypothetical protein HDV05_000586 [Chytridiales sp. JEL 0842]|nr:hypothetical protein HDV05_000586 [Chytridiales sp. JEL 0842]